MRKFWFSLLVCLLLSPSYLVSALGKSPVYIDMEYVIIRPSDDHSVAIMHMTSVKNTLTEDYKGNDNTKGVLNIKIPKGATNLKVLDNSLGMAETVTGFMTKKVIPGKESMILPYCYWVNQDQEGIGFQYSYPVEEIQLLVPEKSGSLKIEGTQYTIEGLFEFEGQKYDSYRIPGVEANKPFTVIYDPNSLPSPEENQSAQTNINESANSDNSALGDITHSAPVFHNPGHIRMWNQSPLSAFNPHILMIVLGVILIGGLSYFSYFRWKSKVQEDQRLSDKEEQAFLQLIAKRKAIMDKIVELEESFSGGQISDVDYRQKFEAYKHHLLQVKVNLQKYTE